eukprot:6538492-Pyramimonas_sp.AAC.1
MTHAGGPTGAFGGAPIYGATKRCTGWWMTHAGGPAGAFGGSPYGATKRCVGWWMANAGGPTGAFGGAPLWGHEALYWVVDDSRGRSHWSL